MRTLETPEIVKPSIEPEIQPEKGNAEQTTETKKPIAWADETSLANTTPNEATAAPAVESQPGDDSVAQQIELLNAIYKATVKETMLRMEVNKIEKQLAELRDELNGWSDNKRLLIDELPEALLRLRDPAMAAAAPKKANGTLHPSPLVQKGSVADDDFADRNRWREKDSQPAKACEPSDTDWKKRETKSILEGVAGLGPKKASDLCDKYPTLGQLQAALVEAHSTKVHFANMLPKGIGKGIADEIQNRLMEAELKPGSIKTTPASEAPAESPTELKKPVNIKHEQYMRAMAASFKANIEDGSYDSQFDSDKWTEGYEAYNENLQVTDCPDNYSEDEKLDWLRGWLSGEMIEEDEIRKQKAEEQESSEPEQDQAQTVAQDPQPEVETVASDLEANTIPEIAEESPEIDLEGLAEAIRAGEVVPTMADREAWNQGYEAGVDEQPVDACPASIRSVREKVESWVSGWVEGSSVGVGL